MFLTLITLPLINFLCGCFFGNFLGKRIVYFSTLIILFTCLISLSLFLDVLNVDSYYKISTINWVVLPPVLVKWEFLFDSMTAVMLVIVSFISFLVHLYSLSYMENDPYLIRFISYLSLFTFFMFMLVTTNNFFQLLVGWEGVGLVSFLLIGFWHTRTQATKSAIKAMLLNRIGDVFLFLSLALIISLFGSFNFDVVFNLPQHVLNYQIYLFFSDFYAIDIICIFLILGSSAKSAQLGLHVWLPDAMEGPTPVSALIHAATMVTAGIFLIVRCSYLFEYSIVGSQLVLIIGSLTAFFAATTGVFQNDIKKIIAYSTCSQLGYMIFVCGLSGYETAMFHLSNHAFFKALLFLGAGSVIHALNDEQDIRKMGGLLRLLPFSYMAIFIGSLALIGFPFLAGFYSKENILELAYSKYSSLGLFAYLLGSLAAFFTAFYSMRLIFLVFLTNPNGNRPIITKAHEGSLEIYIPLIVLSILSIFVGYLTKDFFIGFGTDFWNSSIFISPYNYSSIDVEFINLFFQLLPLFLSFLGLFLCLFLYLNGKFNFFYVKFTKIFIKFYYFLNKKWYFDKIYNTYISKHFLLYSFFLYHSIDRGILETFGPHGIAKLTFIGREMLQDSVDSSLGSVMGQIGFFFLLLLFFFFLPHIDFFSLIVSIFGVSYAIYKLSIYDKHIASTKV